MSVANGHAGQDFTRQNLKQPTTSPTGWTAIRPRIVTGILVNRTPRICVFVLRTASFATHLVAQLITTFAKVFIISAK